VIPHWLEDHSKFWYRNELPGGAREFIVVDAEKGKRQPAFDHGAVAKALGEDIDATHLPIEGLDFDASGRQLTLIGPSQRWRWDAEKQTLAEITDEGPSDRPIARTKEADSAGFKPTRSGAETQLTFDNRMPTAVEIFWLSGDGSRQSYGKIQAGKRKDQHTFGGHRWLVVTDKGETLGQVVANDTPTEIIIDGRKLELPPPPPRRRNRSRAERNGGGDRDAELRSPDGKWTASVQEHNIYLQSTENEERIQLSRDGRADLAYGQLAWSPDSQSLIAFRIAPGDIKDVYLIRSSPEEGGRAQLESRPYALPGDKFATYELNLFRVNTREQLKPEVDRFEHESLRPRLRWSRDGKRVRYEQTDRGHQRFRVIELNVDDGLVRNLIDEQSDTFVWTTHTESRGVELVNWLDETDEIIYATERSGWRHLVLIDAETGKEKNAITSGRWIVRGIDLIDTEKRQVWFRASGCFEQDPYLVHYGRVNFDGTELTWLTAGNGNHTIQLSPDRRFLIDTYSRVDQAPTTELRRASDGKLVCELEQADIESLKASGWTPPEVFSAKGRDGETDIWGIICRPRDFEPGKKYPVIEDIYAGPHSSYVPKSFSPAERYQSLTELGFIVVKIDGMGTAHRSKAFHDVCWQNLKDAGFEDRIAWMKAAAGKYPELDLTRVGIYGTSAGGQNAAAAVLFHPEFYRVAVAACGCHDNRMDKASWNEQWMGYPVGPHYSQCSNIDNAHRLGGKLLLIVGEMDTNVPPESTLRLADALIQADKDFDLLVIPNAGHGMGGRYGTRRMHDFFVEHLLRQPAGGR
ncbi:MAG: prolyl oligopeptidase family serine peptidase, partial [Aureliella sp.]